MVRSALSVWALVFACACVFAVRSPEVAAQELVPRAYVIAPVGSNAVVLQYSHLSGDLQLDGALPITGATAQSDLAAIGLYRAFALFSRTASVTVNLPYGYGRFAGTAFGVPRSTTLSGLLDSSLRLSINLIGGKAMTLPEFARWRQSTLLGASIKIVAPTGQYDSTRLLNWGTNRWAIKPELGYSQRLGHWIVDAYLGGWFFTTNPKIFSNNAYVAGTLRQSEAPIGAFEAHLGYDIAPRFWVSADANFWRGGTTSLNGVSNPRTTQQSSRVGITASIPLTVHQALKLSASDGAYAQYGGNYRSVSLAWQYSWIASGAQH
jgi:Putative MetA-pathway of phenol degradation